MLDQKNKIKYIIYLILFVFVSFSFVLNSNENDLIILKNKNIEVGILPEVGGRVVLLRKPGYENILKSDSTLWKNSKINKPEISAFSDFKAYDGHIVWVGPQNEWWTHQDINMIRRDNASVWPPDPYLIYGSFEVLEQTDSSLKMVGPVSPISGVKLYKDISINNSGVVKFTVTMENIKLENVNWDLWMLTRMDGFAKCYVPIRNNGIIEFLHKEDKYIDTTPYFIEDGFFTLNPTLPKNSKKEQVQEVHLNPSSGFIAGFSNKQMLLIQFEKINQKLIHPNHGLVELYNSINANGTKRLLELEMHSSYGELKPGETKSSTEFWNILPYMDDCNSKSHIKYLKKILSKFIKK